MSVSGSCWLPRDGSAADGVARKIRATAKACRLRRIIVLGE